MSPFSCRRRGFLIGTPIMLALSAIAPVTFSEEAFPNKPLKIIVPFPPGQGADASARFLAKELEVQLGQPVIVDNRPGGNNVIGAKAVSSAPADGYTLLFGTNSPMAANAAFFRNLGYDPVKDFAPVAMLGRAPWVVAVSSVSPIKSFADLVNRSREQAGGTSFSVGATGYQLASILLANAAGINPLIVPYKGSPQAIADMVGQQVTATLSDFGTLRPLIESGQVRPILTFDNQRIDALPNVPSLKDLGLSVPILSSWTALFVRAGTPQNIIDKLSQATRHAVEGAAYKEYIARFNVNVAYAGPQALELFQRKEIDYYLQAMKVGNVEPQ